MEVDSQLTFVIQDIAKSVFHFGFFSCGVSEIVISHGQSGVVLSDNFTIFKPHICPWLNGKTFVFRAHTVGGDKVR